MSIDQTAPARQNAVCERLVVRRPRFSKTVQHIFYSILGAIVAIVVPTLLSLSGVGMSPQGEDIAYNTASASLLAIVFSFVIIRRLLSFPLLQTYGYVALTFASSFSVVAIGLKFFQIHFSSPQFFLGMVIIIVLVEMFFFIYRRWASLHIAVVPGIPPIKLPDSRIRSIKYTLLVAVPSEMLDYSAIVADLSSDFDSGWKNFLAAAALHGIPVHHVKQFNESITGRVTLDHLSENTWGAVVPALIYPQIKRGLDILTVLLLLPFIVPLIGIFAVLIKFETSGPVFFRQLRVGLGGQAFTVFKLRTMKHEQNNGAEYTVTDDGRVTRLGRVLRQYRIDEFPQIVNILRGDMSWIGPRPEAVSLAEWYEREVPFYVYRHTVRPGISGWAQVHQGNVAAVDAARLKLEYDFFYIKHLSFWLDAVIVIKTIRTILTRFGSH
jgi:lipopolysaccharide/colanic/teichoic acid biosynthesis glycosyltransferase